MTSKIPDLIGGGAPLSITTSNQGDDEVRVVPVGEIDRETGPRLVAALRQALSASSRVTIDMSSVSFMDSQGLRVLLEAKMRSDDRTIVITTPSEQVHRLLTMTDLLDVFGLGPEEAPSSR